MNTFSLFELSQLIDHTNLKPNATTAMIEKLCEEAKNYHFKMVAINQVQSKLCANLLKGTNVNIGAAIAFPLGQTSVESKCFETKNAIENGATEIDYVINISELKNGNFNYIENEMSQIVKICREHNVVSKVIFENCYLTDDEKIALCNIAVRVRPDFVKTSTGFGPSGATIEDVKLMKKHVGNIIKVKAAGGIRDADVFKKMISAGAERIGTSSGIPIIEEIKQDLVKMHKDHIDID